MASIRKEVTIDATPEHVWDALRDVGQLHTRVAIGFVTDCRLDGDARVVTFANGMVVRELIVDVDDAARRVAWSAVGGRLSHHNASTQVFAGEGGTSRVVWIADLLPHELAPAIAGMIEHGLGAMRKTLEDRRAAPDAARPRRRRRQRDGRPRGLPLRPHPLRGGRRSRARDDLPLHRLPGAHRHRLPRLGADRARGISAAPGHTEGLCEDGRERSEARPGLLRRLRLAALRLRGRQPGHLRLRVGCLAQRSELPPKRQIWCRSALDWSNDLSGLPQRPRE
jgi:carbon monoxide dehydrogenase subunit G